MTMTSNEKKKRQSFFDFKPNTTKRTKTNVEKDASVPTAPVPKTKRARTVTPPKKKKAVDATKPYKKISIDTIEDAGYNDQYLECVTLKDDKQVVISTEVYDLEDHTKLGNLNNMDKFTTVSTADANPMLVGFSYSSSTLSALSLPTCTSLGTFEMRGKMNSIASDKNMNDRVLVSVGEKEDATLQYLQVTMSEDNTVSFKVLAAVKLRGLGTFGLWHTRDKGEPILCCALEGKIVFVSLADFSAPKVIAQTTVHFGSNRNRKASIMDLAFYTPKDDDDGNTCQVISAGCDGCIGMIALEGERAFKVVDGFSVTTNNKPCNNVAVHNDSGVICTSSNFLNEANFWDMKTSKRIKKVKPLGESMRPGRFTPFCLSFAENGICAFSNSNDMDESPLRLLTPMV